MTRHDEPDIDAGLEALPTVARVATTAQQRGLALGIQCYVSIDGTVVADGATGVVRPGVPLAPSSRMPWNCVTKPSTTVLVAQQHERGELDLDEPVAVRLPEFGSHGKDLITYRHLLTHASGIYDDPSMVLFLSSWERSLEAVYGIIPAGAPGRRFLYLARSAWYALAEALRRAYGVPEYAPLVHERVFAPLGMDHCTIAMPAEEWRALGDEIVPFQGVGPNGIIPYLHHPANSAACAPLCTPGYSGRGPMRELGRLYESLLGVAGRPTLLRPETIDEFGRGRPVDPRGHFAWGLGFRADSLPFKPNKICWPTGAFGHDATEALGIADRRHGLVIALASNGQPRRTAGRAHPALGRQQVLLTALYRDLGLPLFDDDRRGAQEYLDERLARFLGATR